MGEGKAEDLKTGSPESSLKQQVVDAEEHAATATTTASAQNETPTHGQPPTQSAHLDTMTAHAPPHTSSPYNMASMGQSLAQEAPRPGMYPPPPHHRYNPHGAHAMMHPMPAMQQYGGGSSMPISNQGYYGPQGPRMGQVPPSQAQSHMPPRQNMPYYPSQMMMNPAQQYYYPQQTQYPPHPQHMQNPMMQGHYIPPNSPSSDPRTPMPSIDARTGNLQAPRDRGSQGMASPAG